MKTTLITPIDAQVTRPQTLTEQQGQPAPATLIISQVYLGDRLGFYQALSGSHPLTAYEIAIWTDTDETFVCEWLELQAVVGILSVENPAAEPAARRFRLDPLQAKMLADM